jgi:hypothetical protein
MRSSEAKSNEIPPARTVQCAKIHKNLRLSAGLPAFGSLIRQQCTVAELAARRRAHSAEKADVQRYCTSAFGEDWESGGEDFQVLGTALRIAR